MIDERKQFKFTDAEREYIKNWLHGLLTNHEISAAAVIGAIEGTLTKRFDTPEGQLALAADSD